MRYDTNELIEKFVDGYSREFNFYQTAARICSQICEEQLSARGVRAIVSHRAKAPEKLRRKLYNRAQKKKYKSEDDIRDDIPDMAGVRIALYFPGDRERIGTIISEAFDVQFRKSFPERSRRKDRVFSGYHADHYRIGYNKDIAAGAGILHASATVEIQVGSLLMHAWAEVEHDLVYKPESGVPSNDEYAILDELNGLVLAGEIALGRLQKAIERRLVDESATFENQYELAAYLHNWMKVSAQQNTKLGRVDVLWRLLRAAKKPTAAFTRELINKIDILRTDEPVSDLLINILLLDVPELSSVSSQSTLPEQISGTSIHAQATLLLMLWARIEAIVMAKALSEGEDRNTLFRNLGKYISELPISQASISAITQLRQARNYFAHAPVRASSWSPAEVAQIIDAGQKVIEEMEESPEFQSAFVKLAGGADDH